MTFLRILLFVLLALTVRRLVLALRASAGRPSPSRGSGSRGTGGTRRADWGSADSAPPHAIRPDLTEQEISDADYEEIP